MPRKYWPRGAQHIVALGIDRLHDLDWAAPYKICILADADSDGLHIATLIAPCSCGFSLGRAGHVRGHAPYRIDAGKEGTPLMI